MSADIRVRVIDPDDDAALGEFLAFAATAGIPRHRTASEHRVASVGAAHSRVLLAEDDSGAPRAAMVGWVYGTIGDDVVQLNGYAEDGGGDAFARVLDEMERWGWPIGVRELFAHVNEPTDPELRRWLDAGFEPAGERNRLQRAVTSADRDIAPLSLDGVVIVPLAERLDLEPAANALWASAHADIPTQISFDTTRSIRDELELTASDTLPSSLLVAIDDDGELIGLACAVIRGEPPIAAGHRFTAVTPAWRGRGVARALKVELIRWAATNGIERLDASNDEHNHAMRAINDSLGYMQQHRIVLLRRAVSN